jgi:L-lactate dehydrogenase complex protein LldG
MDEKRFLANIASCLERSPGSPRAQTRPHYRPPPAPSQKERIDRLVYEIEKVGATVDRVSSLDDAAKLIMSVLREKGARRVVRGKTALIGELNLDRALEESGIEVMICDLGSGVTREDIRETEFIADCGITSADYGVAETGTLALLAAPGQGRAVSLLPPLHIAVLKATDIVQELAVLFDRVREERGSLPSALTFITGPSRTADIELVLTVGVHGPKELHLVLID